jgi:DNA repair protein RadC
MHTTGVIREAGDLIGIRLLDHIVMAAGGSVSMKRRGLV